MGRVTAPDQPRCFGAYGWDCSHYVRGALMKHNTSGSAASMMHVT
jgi:hypothetical protein